jgi:hypothetical protein
MTTKHETVKSQQVLNQERDAKESKERQEFETEKAARPKEYVFDPRKSAAYESGRDHIARQAYQHRLRVYEELYRTAHEIRHTANEARRRGAENAVTLSKAADEADAAAMEAKANIAPKPELLEPDDKPAARKSGKNAAKQNKADEASYKEYEVEQADHEKKHPGEIDEPAYKKYEDKYDAAHPEEKKE